MYKNNPETYVRRDVKASIAVKVPEKDDASQQEAEFFRCLQEAPLGGFVRWSPAKEDKPQQ